MNRIVLTREPFTEFVPDWPNRGKWPAHWITAPTPHAGQPVVLAFRLRFTLASPTPLEMHVSADERYELFLDGTSIGRGPERGDLRNWFYETYAGTLAAGPHTLVARVWWLGSDGPAPYAQHTHQPAFLLAAAGLHTGVAAWECVTLPGYRFLSPEMAWGTGARVAIDGEHFQWGYERGDGPGWQPVRSLGPAASRVILADAAADQVIYTGVPEALALPESQLLLFGKREGRPGRRMGVALARGEDIATAQARADAAASRVRVMTSL